MSIETVRRRDERRRSMIPGYLFGDALETDLESVGKRGNSSGTAPQSQGTEVTVVGVFLHLGRKIKNAYKEYKVNKLIKL
jgi:hypothetical protein